MHKGIKQMVDVTAQEVSDAIAEQSAGDVLIDATQNVIINAAENVSEALSSASKATSTTALEVPFYTEVEFWIGVAFILSVCVLLKPLGQYIIQSMQNRINRVISDIDEASKLRDDAQNLLADYQRRFINAEKEAQKIVDDSRKNIQNIKNKELAKLKTELNNKEKEANRRISAANTKAIEEINTFASNNSVKLARKTIIHYLQTTDKSRLIDEAIDGLDKFIEAK